MSGVAAAIPDCEILLIGEGGDDAMLLTALAKHAGLSGAKALSLRGRDNLAANLRLFARRMGGQARNVQAFAVVLDAEESAESALAKINGGMAHAFGARENFFAKGGEVRRLEHPGRTLMAGAFVLPGGGAQKGMLEDLFWEAVKNTPEAKCVLDFRDCLGEDPGAMKDPAKRRTQAFLSAMPEHCVNLGVMAEKLDQSLTDKIFAARAFAELREFLRKLSP